MQKIIEFRSNGQVWTHTVSKYESTIQSDLHNLRQDYPDRNFVVVEADERKFREPADVEDMETLEATLLLELFPTVSKKVYMLGHDDSVSESVAQSLLLDVIPPVVAKSSIEQSERDTLIIASCVGQPDFRTVDALHVIQAIRANVERRRY